MLAKSVFSFVEFLLMSAACFDYLSLASSKLKLRSERGLIAQVCEILQSK